MDGCLLNDAFPSGALASAGCLDTKTADESRRQEKKRARKCRGPALSYLNSGMNAVGSVDPDRLTKRMEPVPTLNIETGLKEHMPVTQEYEYFVGGADTISNINSKVLSNKKNDTPSFFGADPNDGNIGLGTKEGFTSAPYVDVIGEDESYRLKPDFSETFVNKDDKAYLTPTKMLPSGNLPYPNVDNFWKENGLAGGQSSFFAELKNPSGQPSRGGDEPEQLSKNQEVLHKLDRIFARLDDMDGVKSENSQTEILLFILTGLGIIFLMDIGCRAAMMKR
jgi:hypothetical protein